MLVALAQLSLTQNMQENLAKALAAMDEASSRGAKLICFPEIQLSPFFPQYPDKDMSRYAISVDHEMIHQLRQRACELSLVCLPNVYLQEGENRFDASPVIDADGKLLGVSKMVHIVQAACFYEQDYYTPSDSGFHVYETAAGRIGVVICFDRHIPESVRTCALRGAQLIVIPTANTVDEPLEMFEWELRVQAMHNGVFIAMCNRVGVEGDMHFCGESIVVDPNGEVLAKAEDTEQILYADLDFSKIDASRAARFYLPLRRPGMYER